MEKIFLKESPRMGCLACGIEKRLDRNFEYTKIYPQIATGEIEVEQTPLPDNS